MFSISTKSARWLVAEVVVVVIGILLAIAIDAWWKDLGDHRAETVLLHALQNEFAANQKILETNIDVTRRRMTAASALLNARNDLGETNADTLNSHWQWVLRGAIYSPSSGVLESAESSGNIALLRDAELRVLLANWPGQVAILANVNAYLTDLIFDHMIPWMRTRTALPNGAFGETGIPSTTRKFDFDALSADVVMENLLREQVAWGRVVSTMESRLEGEIAEIQDRIKRNLEDE